MIEESLLENLLMQSRSVEAGGERYFYIFYHVAVIGSGVYSVAEMCIRDRVILELKLLADVGLLGFPNVGKSTFISVVSEAI